MTNLNVTFFREANRVAHASSTTMVARSHVRDGPPAVAVVCVAEPRSRVALVLVLRDGSAHDCHIRANCHQSPAMFSMGYEQKTQ
jgi:hypothetical protein